MSALPNLSFISEAKLAATKIFEVIDHDPTINSESEKAKVLSHVRGEVEFKDVDFSYPSRPDALVLRRFNLKVQAGKTVGLVGGSGSGKSTVISLLERFYDPINGDILLDGRKIKKLQLKWLRSQMGLVNQEPILFATSIKENILFGKEGASMGLVIKAAKAANAHDFIVKLPKGYETQVIKSCYYIYRPICQYFAFELLSVFLNFTIDGPFNLVNCAGRAIGVAVVRRAKAKGGHSKGIDPRSKDSSS